jgi:hypothetical protein
MLDAILKYWQLVMILVAIVGGAISGYIWLDDRFDGIATHLGKLDDQFASIPVANLARSDDLQQGFDGLGSSLERVRCELDSLIKAGDLLSAAETVNSMLRVLELEKRDILQREQLGPEEEDRLEQIRLDHNRLIEQRSTYAADAQKYHRIVLDRACERQP